MNDAKLPGTREERLAARLRENLHRRKAQARAMGALAPESSAGVPAASADLPADPSGQDSKTQLPKTGA